MKQLEALEKTLASQQKTVIQSCKYMFSAFFGKQKVPKKSVVLAVSSSSRKKINKLQMLQKNAGNGDIKSQISLADCLMKGDGIKQDYQRAFNLYLQAAEQGDRLAEYLVASCLMNGNGTEIDKAKSLSFYIKSAEQGLDKAQFVVGNFYENGNGVVEINLEMAANWYKKAALQGNRCAIKAIQELHSKK